MLRSTPGLNVTVSVYVPSFAHVDDMYIMSSTPLTCSSIGDATVSATMRAFAPVYTAETSTVGGVMFGYWATGSDESATNPESITSTESTVAKIGRSMKKRVNMKN